MIFEVDKVYETVKKQRKELYAELDEATKQMVRKERVVEFDVEELQNDRDSAMNKAQEEAEKRGYASISLVREPDTKYTFELYNKIKTNGKRK